MSCNWDFDRPGNIGLPSPGVELKLVPNEGKLEARLKGDNITPGYWKRPDLTKDAFDADGYYKIGDALKFVDPADPAKGLLFDGRLAEDFKLASGTWVSTGALRAQFVDHFAPLVRDAVIAGADRDDIAALVFPDVEACRKLAGLPAEATPAAVLSDAKVRDEFRKRLNALAQAEHRRLEPRLPDRADGGAAVARRRRSDRQGLDQPARGAEPPRRAGRGALCEAGFGARDRNRGMTWTRKDMPPS